VSATVLDDIRTRCAQVAGAARHVHIDGDALDRYAGAFPVDLVDAPFADPAHQTRGDAEATTAFVVALDAINFGSGWFPVLRKRPGMSGYHTVAASLQDLVASTGPLTSDRLRSFTTGEICRVFDQDPDGEAAELMALFATAWNDLGELVDDRFDGSFTAMVEHADHSAARLVGILDQLPFFHDRSPYELPDGTAIDVPLYKRAQIVAGDLDRAFSGSGPGRFDDLDHLTIYADNLVPHVLRLDGVLEFDDELVTRIDRGERLVSGEAAEVEIRAVAVHAVELIGRQLRAGGHPGATSGRLDYVLWNRGGGSVYKARPRHRCRCVFY
jgi:hypothetical protein